MSQLLAHDMMISFRVAMLLSKVNSLNGNCIIKNQTVWSFLNKLELDLPYVPAIPLLGIYPKEMKSAYERHMFTAAQFTVTKIRTQSRCLPMND